MVNPHLSNRRTLTGLILLVLICLWPLMSTASSGFFSEADLDLADSLDITSRIMSIDYAKGILVVAEHPVMIVDVVVGSERFTTEVIDSAGEAISLDELRVGQTVLVQGLKLMDGRVVGARVQQQ